MKFRNNGNGQPNVYINRAPFPQFQKKSMKSIKPPSEMLHISRIPIEYAQSNDKIEDLKDIFYKVGAKLADDIK